MMAHVLLQSPEPTGAGPAQQLILLVATAPSGAEPSATPATGDRPAPDLLALGLTLAAEYPTAWVVGLSGGADDAAVLLSDVRAWQRRTGVGAPATLLVGHGDGAALALEAVAAVDGLAGRVVAIGATPAGAAPASAPRLTTLHLVHGKADTVSPYGATVAYAEHLVDLGADLTADVLPFVGHDVDAEVAALVIERLRGYLPRRTWDEAMRQVPTATPARGGGPSGGDGRH